MKKDTQCVHSGTYVDPETRGLNTPIFTSSSFEYLDASENVYPRYFNIPNQKSIIKKLCALENAEDGLVFSSGMAATVIYAAGPPWPLKSWLPGLNRRRPILAAA